MEATQNQPARNERAAQQEASQQPAPISRGAPDLLQLLRTLPGIDISRTGGVGQNTSFLLRGTNSNQSLVLIDGVRAASTGTGAYAWEHLPLDQIERIEVVRGPRAAWWGATMSW